jgi:protocatechuate 3,4-dioxygenase beta subunit
MQKVAAVGLFVLFTSGVVLAQETTGALNGRVTDAQTLPVPGATVTVTGPQGVKTSVTDADGRFTAPFLTPGPYDVRVELQGFKAVERRRCRLHSVRPSVFPSAWKLARSPRPCR